RGLVLPTLASSVRIVAAATPTGHDALHAAQPAPGRCPGQSGRSRPGPRSTTRHRQERHDTMTSTHAGSTPTRSSAGPLARIRATEPDEQAFMILRAAFTVAPILFGADKFFHLMVNWDRYLAPMLSDPLPSTPHQLMHAVGVIEIIAGIVVAIHPRLGAPVVAAWLAGIIVNLLLIPGFYDVALRDFGLFLAAVALSRLATKYDPRPLLWVASGR